MVVCRIELSLMKLIIILVLKNKFLIVDRVVSVGPFTSSVPYILGLMLRSLFCRIIVLNNCIVFLSKLIFI